MYQVALSGRVMAELEELPKGVSARLMNAFDRLAKWPNHGCSVRKLSGPLQGLWRVGVGDYRALFSVNTKKKLITITRTGSRQTIY
jgi:mRNA interferase RelE/StbE